MDNRDICKKCIYFDGLFCRLCLNICIDNSEFEDAKTVIENYIKSLRK